MTADRPEERRGDLIAAVTDRVAVGDYDVDPLRVADAILEDWLTTRVVLGSDVTQSGSAGTGSDAAMS